MAFQTIFLLLVCLVLLQRACSRPFLLKENKSTLEVEANLLGSSSLSVWSGGLPSSGLLTTVPSSSSNAVSALTFLTLSYVTYVAANLFFPTALTTTGFPVLEDFSRERMLRSSPSSSQSFLGSVAKDFVTDLLSKTEAAETFKNTTGTALDNGVKIIKRTSKLAGVQLNHFRGQLDVLAKALSPQCLSRYTCKVGQFTSLHLPAIATMVRSIDLENLDDFGQAFVDGTTIGDCDSVYPDCEL